MAGRSGLAFRSCMSATSRIISSSRSRFVLVFGGNRHHDHVAAPIFGQQAAIGELLLDALGLRVGLVDLVDGHDDGHAGGSGVIDGFEGLRHDAVVGRHHQDHDVGDLGAAGAHARERFVAGRVDEDDLAAVLLDLVGADVLRDAAGLAVGHIGGTDGIEQRRLAVIDVAHDGDHGSALHAVRGRLRLPRSPACSLLRS